MEEQVLAIILECCQQHNQVSQQQIDIEKGKNANLYGMKGVLDSLSLVTLIVSIEQGIEDAIDIPLTLADGRAVSQENSPFRTIGTLTSYAVMRITEEQNTHG